MIQLSSFRASITAALLLVSGLAWAQHQSGTGLRGQYYAGKKFEKLVLTRADPTIDFNWTIGPNGAHFVSPGPGVPGEWFSVRWVGHVYAPVTGVYTFQIATDDGMRVWIGGDKVLDSWNDQPVTFSTTHLKMKAGSYYSLRVEYYQYNRDSRAQLAWQLPDSPEEPQPIPTENLYHTLPDNVLVLTDATPPKPKAAAAPVPPVTTATTAPVATPVKTVAKPTAAAPATARPRPVVPAKPAPARPLAADTTTAALPDLTALSKGAAVTLPNLYFTQSTATLLPSSRPTLNALARTLREQPAMQLEIAGHTDNVGEAALNVRLSEQRARVVRQYLVQQGIDSVRLTARGYGGARPVADNRDPQQRPRNRRVEVVVQ
jgi:outer membrane protein OmpA-like peptidoglycan-associated protein